MVPEFFKGCPTCGGGLWPGGEETDCSDSFHPWNRSVYETWSNQLEQFDIQLGKLESLRGRRSDPIDRTMSNHLADVLEAQISLKKIERATAEYARNYLMGGGQSAK